jgi:hypothetical protein
MSVGVRDLYEGSRPGGRTQRPVPGLYAAERHLMFGTLAAGAASNQPPAGGSIQQYRARRRRRFRYIPDAARSPGVSLQDIVGASTKLDLEETQSTERFGWCGLNNNGSALRLGNTICRSAQTGLPPARIHVLAPGALRAGFDDGTATFGQGERPYKYGMDYAFNSKHGAGSNQAVTFTGRFGQTLDEKREAIEAQRAEDERLLIQRTFETRIAAHREKARALEASGDWAGALNQWLIVLEFVPDDTEAAAARDVAREQVLQQQAAAVRDLGNQAVIRTRFAHGLDCSTRTTDRAQGVAITRSIRPTWCPTTRLRPKINERSRARGRLSARARRAPTEHAEWNNVQQYRR